MAGPSNIQTFQAGMVEDVDPHLQPNASYRDAVGGRLLGNLNESDARLGHGLSFTNARGNRFALGLPEGYVELNSVETSRGTVIFSTTGVSSEIGIWDFETGESPSTYRTIYNDSYDPNVLGQSDRQRSVDEAPTERLGWQKDDTFDMHCQYENVNTERVYWTNRRGCIHALNLNDCFISGGQTLHEQTVFLQKLYPRKLSVHAFRERSDAVLPRITFIGRGKGRLLSGVYQVAVRYLNDNGHASVFSPLTRRVFVSSKPLDDDNPDRQAALRANHHNRVMAESGVLTEEALRFDFDGLDVRWEKFQLAVFYFKSPEAPARRVLLKAVPMTELTQQGGIPSLTIADLSGDEMTDGQLLQRYELFDAVGTLRASENRLIAGDITLPEPVEMDVSQVRFEPVLRNMVADDTDYPGFEKKANPITGRDDNDPLTNSAVKEFGQVSLSAFTGVSVTTPFVFDRPNYKGQVYDQLLRGHFRGEPYEFGIMVLDRAGQPGFTVALPAYTFPALTAAGADGTEGAYSLTQLNPATGRYDLRIMGVKISGLALPVDRLYDSSGRLNVSGFMLVRRKRNARLKHQGVVFPACYTDGCYNKEKKDQKIYPLPTNDNSFSTNSVYDNSYIQSLGSPCDKSLGRVMSFPYYLHYHSPDVLIEEQFDKPQPGDQLRHVGMVRASRAGTGVSYLAGVNGHVYVKSYDTSLLTARLAELKKNGRPGIGETSRIKFAQLHNLGIDVTYKEFDPDRLALTWETQAHVPMPKSAGDSGVRGPNGQILPVVTDAMLQRHSVLIKSSDWAAVDISPSEPQPSSPYGPSALPSSSYRIVNYEQTPPMPSTDREPFIPTGHYQPITESVLAQAKKRIDSNGTLTHFVFDDVEVWGGDCYVNLFDFTRLYPFFSDGCEKRLGLFPDYAVSHILPIESKYNLALRWGRTFAGSATKPQRTACDNVDKQYSPGISPQQPEDWKYNNVLSLEETACLYFVRPPELVSITSRRSDFHWTPEKQNGSLIDSFRLRYAGDYGSCDGSLGWVTKLITGDIGGLYVFQQHGFGVAPLNASQYSSAEGNLVIVNSGKVFNGMVPISRQYGTQHPESVWVSGGQIGAWDARAGVLVRHSQAGFDELSRQENLDDLLKTMSMGLGAVKADLLNEYAARTGVEENGDVLMSFFYKGAHLKTLVYAPALAAFSGRLPAGASQYGRRGRYLFGVDATDRTKLFIFDEKAPRGGYYGKVYDTTLLLIVNPAPTLTKRFDNGFLLMNQNGIPHIKSIRQWTPDNDPAQNHLIVAGDERMDWIDNQLCYPMHEWDWEDVKQPLRGRYALVEITIDNTENTEVNLLAFGAAVLPA